MMLKIKRFLFEENLPRIAGDPLLIMRKTNKIEMNNRSLK
jgi:hypothetical protein